MTDDKDFPCRPWTGRRLWTARARYVAARFAYRLAKRHLRGWRCEPGEFFAWHYDDSELCRIVHDQRYHDRELPKWERVT